MAKVMGYKSGVDEYFSRLKSTRVAAGSSAAASSSAKGGFQPCKEDFPSLNPYVHNERRIVRRCNCSPWLKWRSRP